MSTHYKDNAPSLLKHQLHQNKQSIKIKKLVEYTKPHLCKHNRKYSCHSLQRHHHNSASSGTTSSQPIFEYMEPKLSSYNHASFPRCTGIYLKKNPKWKMHGFTSISTWPSLSSIQYFHMMFLCSFMAL